MTSELHKIIHKKKIQILLTENGIRARSINKLVTRRSSIFSKKYSKNIEKSVDRTVHHGRYDVSVEAESLQGRTIF